ncbi:hypothetical protein [Amorphus orientalis]|uniref:Uncharacterized protein n=1 Tax=Amorphus orientalis TaxID=649198 RepID=A0AAE4AT61_9HYPH|nr:hypothetical protein [Amorphus orientalis]MDQ0315837.1 hypothetical protein [Amorphus orientalis]
MMYSTSYSADRFRYSAGGTASKPVQLAHRAGAFLGLRHNCDANHWSEARRVPSSDHRSQKVSREGGKGQGQMIAHRFTTRLIAASAAVAFTAIAVSAGVSSSSVTSTPKTDRFQTVTQGLCADQSWPNISPGCVNWKSDRQAAGKVRFVTRVTTDEANATTTLNRVPASQQLAQR